MESTSKDFSNLPIHVLKTSKGILLLLAVCALLAYAFRQPPVRGGVAAFTPTALYDTCYKPERIGPIVFGKLSLAGEPVPVHKKAISRRLLQELVPYLNHPAQARYITVRARRYFRTIDPILKRNGIPRDFRYVVAVESAFDDDAVSRRGATGIWQLMAVPAQEVGLKMDGEIDERLHLEKATEAACRYIKRLKHETGTWTGALAAYNCGLTRFNRAAGRAAKRSGKADYYKMWICRETGRYVYKVLAIKEIVEHPRVYGLQPATRSVGWPDSRRIRIAEPINSLAAFAQRYHTDIATLRELNPWLVGSTLTPPPGRAYFVLVGTRPTERFTINLAIGRADSAHQARQLAFARDSIAFVPEPGLL